MNKGLESGPIMIKRDNKWYWLRIDRDGNKNLKLVEPQPVVEKIKQGT